LAVLVPRQQPIFWANLFRIESVRRAAQPAATANRYPARAGLLSGAASACYPVRLHVVIRSGLSDPARR